MFAAPDSRLLRPISPRTSAIRCREGLRRSPSISRVRLPSWAKLRASDHAVVDLPSLGPALVTSRTRSEEHTSELQSRENLVCRLLLEKKKTRPGCTPHQKRTR